MGPPRRKLQETVEATLTPPETLEEGQVIARVIKAEGKNLYSVDLPTTPAVLVELPAKFRSTIWLKRGGFVVVDTSTMADRDNKLAGEVVNVVRDERRWRKESYWPREFIKRPAAVMPDDEGDSNMGKMPPSDDDDDEDDSAERP